MGRVAVFRREHFNAAHRLYNPAWDNEKNNEVLSELLKTIFFVEVKNALDTTPIGNYAGAEQCRIEKRICISRQYNY